MMVEARAREAEGHGAAEPEVTKLRTAFQAVGTGERQSLDVVDFALSSRRRRPGAARAA